MLTTNTAFNSKKPARGIAALFSWHRLRFTVGASILIGIPLTVSFASAISRSILLGLLAMTVFGIVEQWPKHLPKWMARWVLQVLLVGLAMPIGTYLIYRFNTPVGAQPFWQDMNRMRGFAGLTLVSMLVVPWIALGALVRQKDALARHQALTFELERIELERNALDSRLRLLQAQVEQHFLFNTLANVRELVDSGSPKASHVLASLIAYLRAAVPRLQEQATTIGQEVELVRAYLELMHLRMPDRLQFILNVSEDALILKCPPTTLLTLVENAVRHGIDPSEEGGCIEIHVSTSGDRCHVKVSDTGVGIEPISTNPPRNGRSTRGTGTGLAALKERLELTFNDDVALCLTEIEPHGVSVSIDFPAQWSNA
ncbi:sensor histidine kinase [Undibacterium sp. SXout11W]|uniref:sensor histidine kinase n=1 Tax=Undibacterium sp. SXout11W TaxID=3413050 RepID=UPI003BF0A94B